MRLVRNREYIYSIIKVLRSETFQPEYSYLLWRKVPELVHPVLFPAILSKKNPQRISAYDLKINKCVLQDLWIRVVIMNTIAMIK